MMAFTKPQQRRKESDRLTRERDARSILLILDLKEDKLQDSGKEEENKTFHELYVLGKNDRL